MKKINLYSFVVVLLLASTGYPLAQAAENSAGSGASVGGIPYKKDKRGLVFADIKRGEQIFSKNCSVCHGVKAEGNPTWKIKGPDGKYTPPPLNGTGHAWHHQRSALLRTIMQGTKKIGGSMPPFAGKLSDSEADAVITWFTSLWPDKAYEIWSKGRPHH
ncbi:MAG: cytochrome c [Gammaproteobacteria bacterium]|nr:cytochrome c [Gammaproteobacteria bacterium]